MSEVWVGVGISKQGLDVAFRPGDAAWSAQNNQAGIKALTRRLKKLAPQRIVLEATGGYEHELARQLGKVGLPVAVVKSTAGQRLCKGRWQAGGDRSDRCENPESFCRGRQTAVPPLKDPKLDVLDQLVTRHGSLSR